MTFSKNDIDRLSIEVGNRMSTRRFAHTLGVVKMAERLASLCLPNKSDELVCAAYLHDVTKELSYQEHIELINKGGLLLDGEDLNTEAILHSFSASYVIKRDFPTFATVDILSAVYNHTIGSPDMSVFDEIIFLSDFIEETRSYNASIELRNFVFERMLDGDIDNNVRVLHEACVISIDKTVLHLIEEKRAINSKNILTRNALLGKI